jgi:hypothetical protein
MITEMEQNNDHVSLKGVTDMSPEERRIAVKEYNKSRSEHIKQYHKNRYANTYKKRLEEKAQKIIADKELMSTIMQFYFSEALVTNLLNEINI